MGNVNYYPNAADAATDGLPGAGFYDGNAVYQTTSVTLPVGTGFFIQHFGAGYNGASETWTNIFTVPQ